MFLQMEEWGKLKPYLPISNLLSIYNILYSPFSESLLWAGGMARGGGWWEVGTEGESQAFSLLFCSLTFLFSFVCQVIHWGFNLFLSLNSFVTEVSCSGFHFSLHLPTCANAIRSDLLWGKKTISLGLSFRYIKMHSVPQCTHLCTRIIFGFACIRTLPPVNYFL